MLVGNRRRKRSPRRVDDDQELARRLGRAVAAARRAREMTQEQLAERLDVSAIFIGLLERGKRAPRMSTLVRLARAIDLSLDAVLLARRPDSELAAAAARLRPSMRARIVELMQGLAREDTDASSPAPARRRRRRAKG